MEHGLGTVQLGDRGQDTAGIAGQQDDVGGHVLGQAGDLGVVDVFDGVGAGIESVLTIMRMGRGNLPASVLSECRVIVVDLAGFGVKDDVFQDRAVADGTVDIGLLLGRQANALGVAAALNVEDAAVAPAVLVVTDEGTVGVGGQGRLAGARQAEEERDVAVLALVGGRVQRQDVVLDGHLVEEDGEDTLLHLAGVLGTQDDHLLLGEVDGHRGGRGHALGVAVGGEGAGIVDGVVGVEVLELLTRRADEHVPHEQGMVGAGADDTDADAVLLVPAGIAVHDVDAVTGVEVVDGTLAVDLPHLSSQPCQRLRYFCFVASSGPIKQASIHSLQLRDSGKFARGPRRPPLKSSRAPGQRRSATLGATLVAAAHANQARIRGALQQPVRRACVPRHHVKQAASFGPSLASVADRIGADRISCFLGTSAGTPA